MTTRARTVDIRASDSAQAVLLRVIENPQYKKVGISLSPLQRAHSQMVAELSLLAPSIPIMPTIPEVEDIKAVDAYLAAFAKIVDAHVATLGRELSSGVIGVDLDAFTDTLSNALEGNAFFEIAKAGDSVEEGTEIRTAAWVP
jgi:hypothetical protein